MHFTRASAAYLSLCLLALATPAQAQFYDDSSGSASIGDYAVQDDFGGAYQFGNDGGTYLLFQKMIGNGTGYSASYQRLGLRAKIFDTGDSHLWGEGHVIITDESRTGFNLGGGYRWLIDGNIVGVNGWFDDFQSDNNNRYSQATFGAEWLSNGFDLRGNIYIPFGDTENFVAVSDPGTVPVFTPGHGLAFLGSVLEEQAMRGFDAEAGVPIFQVPWARAYAGGYFFSSEDGEDAPGVRGRIEAAISNDLSLNFMASNDPVFDTNYNLGIEYRFSGSIAAPTMCPFHGANRKYAQVRRQWPIASRLTVVSALVESMNARTGRPFVVTHVDNENAAAGDGTFANPYQMLPDTAPGSDLILVNTGVGATVGNIRLQNFQRLLGEGKPYVFRDAVRGDMLLPEVFARTGPAPILVPADPSENVITLASRNEVSNFTILADGTTAIGGVGITDFRIAMIGGRGERGIDIVNASGLGYINGFGMPGTPFDVTDTGVSVSNTSGGPLYLDMDTVNVAGGDVGIRVAAMGGDVASKISNVRGNNHMTAGMILSALAGSTHVTEVDNAFIASSLGQTGRGIVLDVGMGGTLIADMDLVGASGNGDLLAADVSSGQLYATIDNSFFSDSTAGHGVRFTLDDALGRTTFNNLNANRNAIDGVNADATGMGTKYLIDIIDSTVIANTDDNFDDTVSGGALLRLFHDPTLAVMAGDNSFEFDVSGPGSTLIAEFEDTNLSTSAFHAVDGNVTDGGLASISLFRSLGTDSGEDGLNLNVDTGGTLIGWFVDGSFSRSGQAAVADGVHVTVADGSTATLNFDNTPAEMNSGNGLFFGVDDGMLGPSTLALNVMNGDFTDNPLANVIGSADGPGSKATLNFTSTTASNMATMGGLVLDATAGGAINTNWTLGSISNTLSNGVRATVDGPGSQIRLNLAGLTIQSNMGDGIDGTLTSGGPGSLLNIDLASTTVRLNTGNGVDLSLTGAGATSRVNMVDSPVTDNFRDGFEFDVLGGAELTAIASGMGSFNLNGERAWHGTIAGPGSVAALNISDINGDFPGLEGGRFDVTAGGLFNLTLSNVNVTRSPIDGILTNVDGMGSEANFRFDSVRLRNNGFSGAGDGFEVVATNGARVFSDMDRMLVSSNRENAFRFDVSTGSIVQTYFNDADGSGNGRSGLWFDVDTGSTFTAAVTGGDFSDNGILFPASGVAGTARDMGTTAIVRFDGTPVDNNSRHGFELFVDTGARMTAGLNTTGAFGTLSASNNTLSGVRFLGLNGGPTEAYMTMFGPNEFNDNGMYGVDIDGMDILRMVAGFSGSAMNNGIDGVNINMDNVAIGSIAIDGAGGTVSGNMGNGVDITVTDTNLNPNQVGPDLIPPLVINGLVLDSNVGHGLILRGINSDLTDGVISENQATNNMGNGLYVMLTDSTADNLQIVRNNASDNTLNGINVELLRTPIDNLQIDDNGTLGGAMVNVGLQFFIDGNTLLDPFDITNSSDPGIDLTNFTFDMSTSVTGAIFNTETGAATPFMPLLGTDVTTGLATVNGTPVPPYPPGLVPDFTQLLDLAFNDFNPNETFVWEIDADFTPGGQETVLGNDLIGSTVIVDFANGIQLTGALMAVPGNPDASIFVATGMTGGPTTVTNNGLNGIRLFADDSDLTNLSMQGNLASGNGASGALIDAVNGSDVTTATLANNELTMNGNGGLVLDFDDSSLTDATISDSSITGNTGDGILFDFQSSPVSNLIIQDNPDIDQNTGNGINFQMVDSNITGLLIDNNGMGGFVPPPAGAFDIQLNLAPGLTPSQIAAFQAAELRWESIITGDVPDIGMIDDLIINASAVAIDGPGGILGQAGPTGLRGGSFLPFQGIMQFDTADLAALEMSGQLQDVILHEMAHVLGFGTIWDNLGLLLNPAAMGGMDPRFTGAQATAEYNTRFGTMDADVPVEAMGGPGTADGHWRESVFTNELMTGFINAGVNPLSRTTIAQFADLGYVVNIGQADPFLVGPPGPPGPSIEGDFAHNFDETVVDFSNAMSSQLPLLRLGNAGVNALVAIQQNGLNGINISLTNSDLTGGVISNNIIAGHSGGDGVRMLAPTTTGTPIELDFDGNTISGNLGGSGVNIAIAQPDLDSTFTGNTISGNGMQGVNLDVSSTATANVDFVSNMVLNNLAEGVNVTTSDMATFNNMDFSGNTVSGNGSIGLHVTAADGSTVDLNLGATGAMNGVNDFNGNTDAGIGIELNDNAVATLDMTQTMLRNTINGPLANFNGDGIHTRQLDTSMLTAVIDGDPSLPPMPGDLGAPASSTVSMTGNAGDGAMFYVDGTATLSGLTILNTVMSSNSDDGLSVLREGSGMVDMAVFANNSFISNGGDGIVLNARNSLLVDDYLILQNRITGNTGNGVHLIAEADGQILADVAFNLISANLGSGILAEERTNDPTDAAAVAGDWVGNTISTNVGQGINLLAEHGTFAALNIGLDGTDGFGNSLGNLIATNGLDGIQIGGNDQTVFAGASGTVSIVNNMIMGNGTAGTAEDTHGIDINTPGGSEIATIDRNLITGNAGSGMQLSNRGELTGPGTNFLTVTADDNDILSNAGDGIEILTSGNDDGADGRQRTSIDITDSRINTNGGRGLEILNRGDGSAFNRARVAVDGTTFNLNSLEAVYVVNTADLAQGLDSSGAASLSSTGNVFNDPILDFTLTDSTITNNGNGSSLSGTGLLVFVGTSGAVTSVSDAGGFVSNGVGGLTGRGGVLGTVTDNTFSGNFGSDVLFQSFTSTVDPMTGTTWDDMVFDATGYQSDPLARFDVTFTGNMGDAADVTRFGAFYANADPVFKSRDTAQTDPGPFDVGGLRRRNAQRLAFRGGAFAAPLISPDGGAFLYPGVSSMSTFRAAAGSTTAGFTLGDTFGTSVPFPGAIFGELPFIWGSF